MPNLITWEIHNVIYFSTEFFLAFSLCSLLIYTVFINNNKLIDNVIIIFFTSIIINTVLLIKFLGLSDTQLVLMNNFIIDTYTLCAKTFVLILAAISIFIFKKTVIKQNINEFIIIFGFSINAALFFLSSFNWGMVFLSLEFLGICTYCLLGLLKKDSFITMEATIKYFSISALSSCFLLLGIFFYYWIFLDINFLIITENIIAYDSTFILKVIAFTLVISFLIKLGCAPFHMWVPDVYEGIPTFMTLILSVVMKSVFFLFFIKLVAYLLANGINSIKTLLILSAGSSIVIGCFGALFQKKIKRILAYSSINNIGYMLIGLSVDSTVGIKTSIMYSFFYFIAVLILFMVILNSKEIDEEGNSINAIVYTSDLHKLKNSKILLSIFILTLFSLAGIPPLSGFFIKFFILKEAIFSKMYALAIIGAFSSVISAFYYINLVKLTLFDKNEIKKLEKTDNSYLILLTLLSLSLGAIFVFPQNIEEFFYFLAKIVAYPYS